MDTHEQFRTRLISHVLTRRAATVRQFELHFKLKKRRALVPNLPDLSPWVNFVEPKPTSVHSKVGKYYVGLSTVRKQNISERKTIVNDLSTT